MPMNSWTSFSIILSTTLDDVFKPFPPPGLLGVIDGILIRILWFSDHTRGDNKGIYHALGDHEYAHIIEEDVEGREA